MRLIGLDPGLRLTGWGVVDVAPGRLAHIANGVVKSNARDPLSERLNQIHQGLVKIITEWQPDAAAVEETFVNQNPASTLKLGQARGAVIVAAAGAGLQVAEYAPNRIKKSVVGVGHASKVQIRDMVGMLLPGCAIAGEDAADALAVAICHAHHMETAARWSEEPSHANSGAGGGR
jgi:crossover junction endodeoxyribonuclease RuvC